MQKWKYVLIPQPHIYFSVPLLLLSQVVNLIPPHCSGNEEHASELLNHFTSKVSQNLPQSTNVYYPFIGFIYPQTLFQSTNMELSISSFLLIPKLSLSLDTPG